ncbi:MAG: hypothetical protein ACO3AD_10825, partial [Burkholderiaceae bacterium]
VPLDSSGTTVVLTPEQVKRGKRLFNASCYLCPVCLPAPRRPSRDA